MQRTVVDCSTGQVTVIDEPDVAADAADLLAYSASMRYAKETGGITVSGTPIRTDETSQAKITGAVNLFDKDEALSLIQWEATPGVWATIDKATMTAIGIAVGRHVQACFATAKTVFDGIMAGTINTTAAIDAAYGDLSTSY